MIDVRTAEGREQVEEVTVEYIAQRLQYIIQNKMLEFIPEFVEQIRIMEDMYLTTGSPEAHRTGLMFAEATKELLEMKYGEVNLTYGPRVRSFHIRNTR